MVHVGFGSEGAPYIRSTAAVRRSVFGGNVAIPRTMSDAAGWENVSA